MTSRGDFVVRGGSPIDGRAGFYAPDVAVSDGRIVGMGTHLEAHGREIDAPPGKVLWGSGGWCEFPENHHCRGQVRPTAEPPWGLTPGHRGRRRCIYPEGVSIHVRPV
jgi:hypothetical protein